MNTHMPVFNAQQPMAIMNGPVTDITVQVGSDTIPFAGLPANGIVANFPEKGLFISTDRSAIIKEIEAMASASKQVLASVPTHQKMVQSCDALLVELNPERKKEQMQSQELSYMRGELAEMKKLLLAIQGTKQKEE